MEGSEQARPGSSPERRVSYLDQALWKSLSEAGSPEAAARSWLTLQCRMIDGVASGVACLGLEEIGPFAPLAFWPDGAVMSDGLRRVVERAVSERRSVVWGHGQAEGGTCFAAHPFMADGKAFGAVAIEVTDRSEEELRGVVRLLQWGVGWIEALRRRGAMEEGATGPAAAVLSLVATAMTEDRFNAASLATVTDMANRFHCERVSVGFVVRSHARVQALSLAAHIGRRMSLVRRIGASMDEAVDQRATILFPNEEVERRFVTASHSELSRTHGPSQILTLPFGDDEDVTGAFVFERTADQLFDQETIDQIDAAVAATGPILLLKRQEDRNIFRKIGSTLYNQTARLFGRQRYGRKLAALGLLALLAFSWFATGTHNVAARAELEGTVQRVVVAPFDGYLRAENVRAGDTVGEGETLAVLDDRDLAVERERLVALRARHLAERARAVAERDATAMEIRAAQIAETDAEIARLDDRLTRASLIAPFDGVVVSGDLRQSVGAPVAQGDILFEIAPLTSYRLMLRVEDEDILTVAPGQPGHALLTSLPTLPIPLTVEKITPVSEPREGRNTFLVEARIEDPDGRLRPGMEGIAKIDAGERRLVWIWTHDLIRWIRIQLWSIWP